jgi:hypothetical protein
MPVIKKRVDKKNSATPGWWSEKERYQACATWLLLGKDSLTSAATGIPEETLRYWRKRPWWPEMVAEIQRSSKVELSGKIKNIVNKTLLQLEDRVENGDFLYDPKTGQMVRKPINANVASKITSELIEKTLMLDKEAVKEEISDTTLDDRLKKLRDEMVSLASKVKFNPTEIINVEPIPSDPQLLPEPLPEGQ